MQKVYKIITDRIISLLKKGTVPWHQTWKNPQEANPFPKNFVTQKEYRGINVFILASASYSNPYWLTFKQAKSLGGKIRKGEHGFPCIFWKWIDGKDEDEGMDKKIPLLRYYTVFNISQCEGIEIPEQDNTIKWDPIEKFEKIIEDMPNPPTIIDEAKRPYYHPGYDVIRLPNKELFESAEEYYCVLGHELIHASGHPDRLGRDSIVDMCPYGSTGYSKEEIVAEMGVCFLCGYTGIENKTIKNSTAYISGWLQAFNNDKKMVIIAASQAQKAVDYILGKIGVNKEEDSENV